MTQKVGLVTGSSKGIGAAISKKLAKNGYFMYITYHTDKTAALQVLSDIRTAGGSGEVVPLDVRDEASVRGLYENISKRFAHLNVLVNNAVTEIAKDLENVTFDEWKVVTETKINGTFLCTKYGLPLLARSENANMIIITSFDGVHPVPDYIAYGTGTAAIIGFARAMALYMPRFGIRVNCISPGATRTPLWDKLGGKDESLWAGFASANPLGRVSTVEDVANAVTMIIDDPGRYLNGNNIYVDGGSHLRQP